MENISRFDPSMIKGPKFICIDGQKGTGKTSLMLKLLDYSNFYNILLVHGEYDGIDGLVDNHFNTDKLLRKITKIQEDLVPTIQKYYKHDYDIISLDDLSREDLLKNGRLVALDDCCYKLDKLNMDKFRREIDNIALNGHASLDIGMVVAVQSLESLDFMLRQNIDFCFVFGGHRFNMNLVYEEMFSGCFDSFEEFTKVYNILGTFDCLVVKKGTNDELFWYNSNWT
jgi:hypothetical protein